MKVIIAGSRSIVDISVVEDAVIFSHFDITEVVSGTASGVDRLGEEYAEIREIPTKKFPAEWDKYGRSAGYRRNQEMADYADACLCVWDGKSRGTKHMIEIAEKKAIPLAIYRTDGEPNFRTNLECWVCW